MDKYSVIVSARTRDEMRALGRFGYDLFPNTAKDTKDGSRYPLRIDGLLTTEEIEALVKAGYRVAVEEAEERLSAMGRQEPALEFEDWLKSMQPFIEADRKAAE